MIYEFGDMWDIFEETDVFCITTNSILRNDGKLVMGRGIAKEAIQRFPTIQNMAGIAVKTACESGGQYGLIYAAVAPCSTTIALFQVKLHWRDMADPDLIQYSTDMLSKLASKHPEKRFDLNFPGIGNGHLRVEDVQYLLEILPDNVYVWRFKR